MVLKLTYSVFINIIAHNVCHERFQSRRKYGFTWMFDLIWVTNWIKLYWHMMETTWRNFQSKTLMTFLMKNRHKDKNHKCTARYYHSQIVVFYPFLNFFVFVEWVLWMVCSKTLRGWWVSVSAPGKVNTGTVQRGKQQQKKPVRSRQNQQAANWHIWRKL